MIDRQRESGLILARNQFQNYEICSGEETFLLPAGSKVDTKNCINIDKYFSPQPETLDDKTVDGFSILKSLEKTTVKVNNVPEHKEKQLLNVNQNISESLIHEFNDIEDDMVSNNSDNFIDLA